MIVRVDHQATVYELKAEQPFQVKFDDSNQLYRRVALNYESDGDIILELESVQNPFSAGGSTNNNSSNPNPASGYRDSPSCAKALPSRLFIGANAKVIFFQLKSRVAPGFTTYSEHTLAKGRVINVLEGPVCADEAWWWRIHFAGTVSTGQVLEYEAWMVEADNDTYYLQAVP